MEYPDGEIVLPDTSFYTPETIAWKLYQDDFDIALSSQLLGFGPAGETDELSYKFEMLLSIFLEMLIHIMKMDIAKENEENNTDLEMEPDFEDFDMELYYPIIRNKFKRICYLVSVETFERKIDNDYEEYDKEFLMEVVKERYSRVILRHNPEDTHYFESIESDDYYDFIPSVGYNPKKKLRDIYSIMTLNNKMYRIKFDFIEKIGSQIIKY